MITKERLKKLIEECATIYSNDYGEIQLIKENDLILYENGQNNYILYALEPNKKYHNEIFDEDLFETKEEAEFSLEFQNITRTETLNLPTWEELNKKVDTIPNMFWQIAKCSEFILFLQTDKTLNNAQIILRGNDYTYNWGLTKENYLEACKIAKKLFLGEEYE